MQPDAYARSLLQPLTGQEVSTVTGRPNRILRLDGDDVIVATDRRPGWAPQCRSNGADRPRPATEEREVEVSVASLGHRSSFVGAALLTLPDAPDPDVTSAHPAGRPAHPYKLNQAGHINAWWRDDPRQRFWLEITDRDDVGVDLHCPQRDSDGQAEPWLFPHLVGATRRHRAALQPEPAGNHLLVTPCRSGHRGSDDLASAPQCHPASDEAARAAAGMVARPGWPIPATPAADRAQLTGRDDDIRPVLHQLEEPPPGKPVLPVLLVGRLAAPTDAELPQQAASRARRLSPAAGSLPPRSPITA